MTDVINVPVRGDRTLLDPPDQPIMSADLASVVERVIADPSLAYKPDAIAPRHCAEAAVIAPAFAAMCRTRAASQAGLLTFWLRELAKGMSFPLPANGMMAMMDAVLRASGDLPAVVFNADTLAEAARSMDRMSASAIDKVVRPAGRDITSRYRALAAIVALHRKPTDGQSMRDLPAAERDAAMAHIAGKVEEARTAQRPGPSGQIGDGPAPVRARYLDDRALLAQCERIADMPGNGRMAAIARRDALRKKLGVAP